MKNDLFESLKEKVRKEKITLKQIGSAIGKTEATVSRKMSGKIPITISELKEILKLCESNQLKSKNITIKL